MRWRLPSPLAALCAGQAVLWGGRPSPWRRLLSPLAALCAGQALVLLCAGQGVQRTGDSVDVQVCVGGALSTPSRGAFQGALAASLQAQLRSDAVYLDSTFTDAAGDYCLLYVYQAPDPASARAAFVALNPKGAASGSLALAFGGAVVNGTVSAAQWSGDDTAALGVPLPASWSPDDLLLWGSCAAGAVALAAGAGCCYAGCVTARSEDEAARALLRADRELLRQLARLQRPPPARAAGGRGGDDL